jgi:hypothetical protein
MNKNTNLNINLSPLHDLPILRNYIKNGITNIPVKNVIIGHKEIELESNKNVSIKKANTNVQTIIVLSDMEINTNKSELNLLNKNQFNLNISNSENLNNELTKSTLNESSSILKNEQQFIRLISPFNSKLASLTNHIYTFTNRSYKKINTNLHNLDTICKLAFNNMSSIISKPMVSNNPNLIKIRLFYY